MTLSRHMARPHHHHCTRGWAGRCCVVTCAMHCNVTYTMYMSDFTGAPYTMLPHGRSGSKQALPTFLFFIQPFSNVPQCPPESPSVTTDFLYCYIIQVEVPGKSTNENLLPFHSAYIYIQSTESQKLQYFQHNSRYY